MPTPFQHLNYARGVFDDPALPESIRSVLLHAPEAYFFGSTAVDVQAVTGQPRVETHFYRISSLNVPEAGAKLLTAHPELRDPHALKPEHAAFISGYLVHLAWDEVWARDVFIPFYEELSLWPDRWTRSVHHDALRIFYDRQAEAELRAWPALLPWLRRAIPHHWLPFVADADLCRWRDWLVEQLEDPALVQTAHVFAERLGIAIEQLESVVQAVALGTYTPPIPGLHAAVRRFEAGGHAMSMNYLLWYWKLHPEVAEVLTVDWLPRPAAGQLS